ncbi:MAG: hypothetical protein ACI8PW_000574 [Methylophilaceae bacterium]|jgi:hypothetical protein
MKISEITIKPIAPIAPIKPLTPGKATINALQTQKDRATTALKTEKQSQQRTKAVAGLQKAQQTLSKVGYS